MRKFLQNRDLINEFKNYHRAGHTQKQLADQFLISVSSVKRIINDL